MKRIAFSGKMGSGKSTAAKYLGETYELPLRHFAEPVKKVAGLAKEDPRKRKKDLRQWASVLTPDLEAQANLMDAWEGLFITETDMGRLYQGVGAIGRHYAPGCWVEYLTSRVQRMSECVIDDLRYPDELEALQRLRFTIVRIEAPRADRLFRLVSRDGKVLRDEAHASETALDNTEFPVVFQNRGSLADLLNFCDALVI